MARPKLAPGEKGNYHVSKAEQLKRKARKQLGEAERAAKQTKAKAQKASKKAQTSVTRRRKAMSLIEFF